LERLTPPATSRATGNSGASTILSLVPEGTPVKAGDVICELDKSDYEELVRQQEIRLEEARAAKVRAELDFRVAEMAVHEFQDGLRVQSIQDYRGQIALAESEVRRLEDRVGWSTRMSTKGYVSVGQVASEKFQLETARQARAQAQITYDNFLHYGAPRTLRELTNEVERCRDELDFERMRLEREEAKLARYRQQVEYCTIRAPHEGIVIYIKPRGRNAQQIEVGTPVHQRQALFYLPDLAEMEVEALFHETVVDRIRPGMRAKVRIEAMSGRLLEGEVVSVGPLPYIVDPRAPDDVKNYLGRIRLDAIPGGLRPGMSAEVEIVTGHRDDALLIPPDAVRFEGGHEVCYVAEEEGLERREVEVRPASTDYLEVTEGLGEGEQVVLEPSQETMGDGASAAGTLEEGAGRERPAL
jgi:HlyD family secretion protein